MVTAEIRKKYPLPRTGRKLFGPDYCVGEAFILSNPEAKRIAKILQYDTHFIMERELVNLIKILYPKVRNVGEKCLKLTAANDAGSYEKAWKILESMIG